MELKQLVPPSGLCKLIPEGEFEDSALIWIVSPGLDHNGDIIDRGALQPRDRAFLYMYLDESVIQEIYPAPTWEEIMAELGQFTASCYDKGHTIEIATGCDCVSADSAVDGAMKLWLKTKGIDYGKIYIR